jgi:hypothetical protein
MLPPAPNRARSPLDLFRASERVRLDAAHETAALFDGVSGKRITAAAVPGATRNSISRALNGCESNPAWRLAGWFVLCRRLGIPKAWPQRLIDWLQTELDRAYGDTPPESLEEVLDRDAELDGRDDLPRQRAARGDRRAMVELLEIEEQQLALGRTVVARLRAEVATLAT